MRKPFFKAVVAGMASVAMIAGMSACGRSANNADSDSDAVKTIDFIEALPRNASGKILRRELREPYWAGRARRVN